MADYTTSKAVVGAVYPINASASATSRLEPLISPQQVRTGVLFGLPLISATVDPVTRRAAVFSDAMIKDCIDDSIAELEEKLHVFINPVQFVEKYAFDRCLYDSFLFFKLRNKPVSSIEEVCISPPNNENLFQIPPEWIETANMATGQINVLPINAVGQNPGALFTGTTRGGAYLHLLRAASWIPAWWRITYTAGFPDAAVPRIVNRLIGIDSGIEICSRLAATNAKHSSYSLGLDGINQSVSGPGAEIFTTRINELKEKRKEIVSRVKAVFGGSFVIDNV